MPTRTKRFSATLFLILSAALFLVYILHPYIVIAGGPKPPKTFDEAIELLGKSTVKQGDKYVDDAIEIVAAKMWKSSTRPHNEERKQVFREVSELLARDKKLSSGQRNRLKAIMGEINVEVALIKRGNLSVRRNQWNNLLTTGKRKRSVYHHGIDNLIETTKKRGGQRKRTLHIVEAKSTENTGRIGVGILPKKIKDERQMSEAWLKKNYDDILAETNRIMKNSSDPRLYKRAKSTRQAILSLKERKATTKAEKTLVITRVKGYHGRVGDKASLTKPFRNSLKELNLHVIEVDPSGLVINVYKP